MTKPTFDIKKADVEIKPVCGAVDLFEKTGNWIVSTILQFVEKIIKQKLYVQKTDSSSDISFKTKQLISNLIKKKFIVRIIKKPRIYHDEPEIIWYEGQSGDFLTQTDGGGGTTANGSGADFDEEVAILKTINEGLERFSLCVYRNDNLLFSSYEKIAGKAINPSSFAGISDVQRQSDKRLEIKRDSCFRWVKGFSLPEKKDVFIPAQLVYVGYRYHLGEPLIQQQISTGAAAATSFEEALYSGICETVERDAFVITYFNKLSPPLINLETIDDVDFQKLLASFKRYNLELYVINTTTDIAIPSVMAIIVDRTGVGPAVHVGNKTDLNFKKAIIGAVCECLKGRLSYRGKSFNTASLLERMEKLKNFNLPIKNFEDRFLYWASVDSIPKIDFLLQGRKQDLTSEDLNQFGGASSHEKLETVLNLLKSRGVDVYAADITPPQIREEGIWITKVVIPQLQPFFLKEEIKELSGKRLFEVPVILGYRDKPLSEKDINTIPHPFL